MRMLLSYEFFCLSEVLVKVVLIRAKKKTFASLVYRGAQSNHFTT